MTTKFERVSVIFQNVDLTVEVANLLDKAYAEGTGNPDWHSPFDASAPEKVAMNSAGLYAADTAANMLAMMSSGEVTEESYVQALTELAVLGNPEAQPQVSDPKVFVALNAANLAWRAGQPFRDIGSKPLNRIGRSVNAQWTTLDKSEVAKDLIQVTTAARWLLAQLNS